MAIKHNQKLPHNHFRKDWQRRVKCHFDQAGKKVSRRIARASKVASLAPRPVDKLRPVVRCPTIKYNRKLRVGRGFTLDELKAAGIPRLLAPTVGISVDSRRKNLSEESLSLNVARLKAYKEKLILFPRKVGKPKKGDNPADLEKTKTHGRTATAIPFVPIDQEIKEIKKSDMPKPVEGGAYFTLRMARSDKRQKGGRDHRKAAKAEAEANKK